MPMINNNVSVIKQWLDQGGDLSKLLSDNYDGTSFQELKNKIDLILEDAPESLDSFKELAELLNNDKSGLEAILKQLGNKVDKEEGKELSANDFTDELKNKLETMPEGGTNITVDSELSETSENPVANKVVTAELKKKVTAVNGKGLSTNDFTDALKNKLDGIEPNATALPKVINIYCENQLDERIAKWNNKSLFNEYTDDGLYYFSLKYNHYGDINDEYTYFAEEAYDALLLVSVGENGGTVVNQTLIIDGNIYTTLFWREYDDNIEWEKIYDLTRKANKENAFDYYVEINQDKYFEYDKYTKIGTYLLCRKTDEDYHGGPPWQYYKLLTVVDGDPDYLVQTEYDLSHGGCRTRNNFNEETGTAGDWNPWVNVFVSQWDLTNAIGDVEASLENIIAKYGLGGDGV